MNKRRRLEERRRKEKQHVESLKKTALEKVKREIRNAHLFGTGGEVLTTIGKKL